MAKINQQQHKLPKVYLKKFGYKNKCDKWMVSIGTIGSRKIQQRSIKTFTTALNHFDIESDQDDVIKVFEDKFNQLVEVHYNRVVNSLYDERTITVASKEYLSQMVPNFIVRSDFVREQVIELLKSSKRDLILKLLIAVVRGSPGVAMIDQNVMFESYKKIKNEQLINRVLILLSNYLFRRIWSFEFVLLAPPNGRQWWTSTNPVVTFDDSIEEKFVSDEIEFYMPLTPQLLLYIHSNKSANKSNPLRQLKSSHCHQISNETYDQIMKHIMINSSQTIILAGEYEDDFFS